MPRIGYSRGFEQGLECRRRPNHRKSYKTICFNFVNNLVPKYLPGPKRLNFDDLDYYSTFDGLSEVGKTIGIWTIKHGVQRFQLLLFMFLFFAY